MAELLVIDDDIDIADAVAARLRADGHRVEVSHRGDAGLTIAVAGSHDLVVLDLTLPGLDGIEVCRRLQAARSVPVLMLTARDDEADLVLGLEVGADDYLTKPFSPRELSARVRAILRRVERERGLVTSAATVLERGDVVIDTERRIVTRAGDTCALTATEFDLVAFLANRPGVVHSRLALLAEVWGYRDGSGARTVDSHIRAVRRKLGDDVIRTVHGVGYAFGIDG